MGRDEVWYSGGVRFQCLECGRCCRGESGAIWMTDEEVRRMAEALGLEEGEFRSRYMTTRWGRQSLRERVNGDCVMLDPETNRCRVYPVRPLQCSLFPFWRSVMRSRDRWEEEARRCPGMGEGRLWSVEDVEERLSRSPFPDL
ncbi:YkgJ family cysteine cluster protein [Thermanaerovibrio acidaminovorans]|jgi:hypothetical protein|uniref:YkgJ family cysteine cluster protein n=1 Tax=Thermanaerovibrio acidaminovorans TaxID=81462 RepID=UPI002490F77C|nr:YkgJ family cysteine cluster protein [Thermanaerovibrio acidaminovorans]